MKIANMTSDRHWVAAHIINTDMDKVSRRATFGELTAYDVEDGYLVPLNNVYYYIPTDIKSIAAEALVQLVGGHHRKRVMERMPHATLVPAEEVERAMSEDIDEYWRDVRDVVAPQESLRQVVKLKYAVLICFEGDNAEQAADAYSRQLRQEIFQKEAHLLTAPGIYERNYKVKVCCVDLHDCQKHPLKG